MRIKIKEETRYQMSNILIEIMDNVKKEKKYLNTITLEGLTLILQKLKSAGKSQVTKDLVQNFVEELAKVTNRVIKKTDTKLDEYTVKCMLKTFLMLVDGEGTLDEIYHFSDKGISVLKYNDDYHSYISVN